MEKIQIFIQLTRLNKPIGFLLLFWPCSWGLTLAFYFNGNLDLYLKHLFLFFLGSILMRSAGCIVNDIVDKDFDKRVERTKGRPIASNKINEENNLDTITLRLLNPTWLQIRDNSNNIILSKLMDKGEEFNYNMSLQYNITVGNAGNILLIINQDVVGKIGKFGEVIDSLIIDNSFKN